jgi:hypothetical protein
MVRLKKIGSRFWFILGTVLILLDPVLAHLSNANLIKWPVSWEMSKISAIISRTLIASGIILLMVAYFKLKAEKKTN